MSWYFTENSRVVTLAAASLLAAAVAPAQYYPNMVYGPKETIAPGVTWQVATNPSPAQRIIIIEVDMTNPNVELMPVIKAAGNTAGTATLERPTAMAARVNALAIVNAGYFAGTGLTNSYTEIDGVFLGGADTNMRPESNRSVLGFSGDHQSIARRTKLSTTFVPTPATDWDKIVDGIAGRGHFTWNGATYTVDNEGTTAAHYASRHPRTVIGYKTNPYTVYLVAVDGRAAGVREGMTYDELARLMADIGAEQSVSLDGGGSTLAWVKGEGIVNVPSDGSERSVISSWAVVNANTMDNTVSEVTSAGTWTTDTAHSQKYYLDQLVTDDSAGLASVTWAPDLDQDGLYRVFAWWTEDPSRASAAPYEIVHADGTDVVEVDQRYYGGQWRVLGTYAFEAATDGSVTLRNSTPGTVSADAVRFLRIGEIPAPAAPEYTIAGTLYFTDFETDVSSDFTVAQQVTGDNSVNFQYDYSTFAQAGGGYPEYIPQSPSSPGPGTRALRLGTNLSNGVVNGITATLDSIPGKSDLRITFDAWLNYTGGYKGGTGSTEFATFGASSNPSLVQFAPSTYASAGSPYGGFFFAMTGEGGAAGDYRYYDGNGTGGSNGNNASRVNYLGSAAQNDTDLGFLETFNPVNLYETPGNPGKAWNTWEILVVNGQVRLAVTKPDGHEVVLADWFTPNANATLTNLLPALGLMDPFASVASPTAEAFVLYDNLKVENLGAGSVAEGWEFY